MRKLRLEGVSYLPVGSKTQVLMQPDLRLRADHGPVAHRRWEMGVPPSTVECMMWAGRAGDSLLNPPCLVWLSPTNWC